jgi:hypothetical protein
MVGDIDTTVDSKVDTSSHHNTAGDTEIGSHNTDDHSSGHNTSVSSDSHNDSHNQTAGGNLSDSHAQQTNIGGTVINVPPGEQMTHHPDGTVTLAPPAQHGGGGGGGVHHDYPKLHSHGPTVAHWKKQLNAVMQAGLPEDSNFDQDTHDWTVYFQNQNGLTGDGVVGPQSQAAMDSQYRPDMGHHVGQDGGGYGDQPYHPSTHGQFDPNQHGQFDPNQHGQFHPELHGDFNPYVHGQYDPQLHGDFNPYVHGQYDPQYHGEFDPQIHGQYHPETHGQYHPELHGQYHPDKHGQFDVNLHGQHDPALHGEHDPAIHGELSIY